MSDVDEILDDYRLDDEIELIFSRWGEEYLAQVALKEDQSFKTAMLSDSDNEISRLKTMRSSYESISPVF